MVAGVLCGCLGCGAAGSPKKETVLQIECLSALYVREQNVSALQGVVCFQALMVVDITTLACSCTTTEPVS